MCEFAEMRPGDSVNACGAREEEREEEGEQLKTISAGCPVGHGCASVISAGNSAASFFAIGNPAVL